MCGWILRTIARKTLVAVDCLQQQSDGQAWLSTQYEQWEQELGYSFRSWRPGIHQHFLFKDSACGTRLVLAPVTDQVELTVSRLLALASTGCGASWVLEMYSVSWCSGEECEDGLINHHSPPDCALKSREQWQTNLRKWLYPTFVSLVFAIMHQFCPKMLSLISVLNNIPPILQRYISQIHISQAQGHLP